MNRLRRIVYRIVKRPSAALGQGIIEYVLILMFVGIAAILVIQLMEPQLGVVYSRIVGEAPVAPPALLAYTPPPTVTNTPTIDPSASVTPTPSATPSPTNTPVPPTNTATNTPLPTATATNTATPTNTPTPTITNTPVPTNTPTQTPIPTNTPTPEPVTITIGENDGESGYVEESGNTNTGGTSRTNDIRVGDNNDRQLKGILSFDTSAIPAGATIQSVELRLRRRSSSGNPYGELGAILFDIGPPSGFNGNTNLQNADFQAAAAVTNAGTLGYAFSNGDWANVFLNSVAIDNINIGPGATTQFRLRFPADDSNDGSDDYIRFFDNTPRLVVTYIP